MSSEAALSVVPVSSGYLLRAKDIELREEADSRHVSYPIPFILKPLLVSVVFRENRLALF